MRSVLLALLAKESAHGYELKHALERTFGSAYPSPNIGQIYVTLGRLEKDGLVRVDEVAQTSRPNKRVYELTAAGREELAAWIEEPGSGPRVRSEFFLKLAVAPLSGTADQVTLINRQRRHLLTLMRDLAVQANEEEDNPISDLLIDGARLHLQADLDWLIRCQEELT